MQFIMQLLTAYQVNVACTYMFDTNMVQPDCLFLRFWRIVKLYKRNDQTSYTLQKASMK